MSEREREAESVYETVRVTEGVLPTGLPVTQPPNYQTDQIRFDPFLFEKNIKYENLKMKKKSHIG